MNSKSIGTFTHNDGNDTGMVEVFEPDEEGDMELVLFNDKLRRMGTLYLSPSNAYDLAVALIQAAGSKL